MTGRWPNIVSVIAMIVSSAGQTHFASAGSVNAIVSPPHYDHRSATDRFRHAGIAATAESDWLSFGFDLARTGSNVSETTISMSTINRLHLLWTIPINGGAVAQPVLASSVNVNNASRDLLYVGSLSGYFYAIDAGNTPLGPRVVWHKTPTGSASCVGPTTQAIESTAAIDRGANVVYVPDASLNLHAYDLGTGVERWSLALGGAGGSNSYVAGGLTYNPANHLLYVPISANCEGSPPWQGGTLVVNTLSRNVIIWLAVLPSISGSQNRYYGGSVWGYGGASVDASNNEVYVATGNGGYFTPSGVAVNQEPLQFTDAVVRLNPTMTKIDGYSVPGYNAPAIPGGDADFGATPVLYQVNGCPPQALVKNKSGQLLLYDRDNFNAGPIGPLITFGPTAPPAQGWSGRFIGVPAISIANRMVYVTSSFVGSPSYSYGLTAFTIGSDCLLHFSWNQNHTPVPAGMLGDDSPLSMPTVAGGIVYYGWGFDATTPNAFGGVVGYSLTGVPAFSSDNYPSARIQNFVSAAPVVINGHMYVVDHGGISAKTATGALYAYGL